MSETSNWADRAKKGLRDTAQFVADHGTTVGLSGATGLGIVGVSMIYGAQSTPDPEMASNYTTAAAALMGAAVLKAAGFAAAEQICQKHLPNSGVSFDDPQWRANTKRDLRGATPLPINDELNDPRIQEASKQLFNDLANSPDTRSEIVAMVRSSPLVRSAFKDHGGPDTELDSMITPVASSPDDDLEDSSGPRL